MPLLSPGLTRHSSTFTGSETAANLNSGNAKTVTVKAKWKANDPPIPTGACTGTYGRQVNVNLAVNGTQDFAYRGSVDCAYLQKAGYYKLEVWGAQGGTATYSSYSGVGGYGGYSYGKIYSENGSSLYVIVGGRGISGVAAGNGTYRAGGFNGGGYTYDDSADNVPSSGGGATHISVQNCGELKNCSSYKGAYNSSLGTYDGGKILIVAGGGGGGGLGYTHSPVMAGGNGGGMAGGIGYPGYNTDEYVANQGGTQTSGGTSHSSAKIASAAGFGVGASYSNHGNGWNSSGGGGGWYGGGIGYWVGAPAGGGSGYIGNSLLLSDKKMYCYTGNSNTKCTTSTAVSTYTVGTSSTGAHVANRANTGDGYARITYLGT